MNVPDIEKDFRKKVAEKVTLHPEGLDRFRVFTPFLFEDGDHLAVVMKRENSHWVLSDEGHTYMHLTYDIDEKDLQRGTRQKVISKALSVFNIHDRQGEMILPIKEELYIFGLPSDDKTRNVMITLHQHASGIFWRRNGRQAGYLQNGQEKTLRTNGQVLLKRLLYQRSNLCWAISSLDLIPETLNPSPYLWLYPRSQTTSP